MNFDIVNIFPTTIYVGEVENHLNHREEFYKIYPKFDYPQVSPEIQTINTVSENQGNPLIHLEETLNPLFTEISKHVENYIHNVLKLKDIFDIVIVKSWLSRSRETTHEIPWHIHSPSQISFVYYLNTPENSHLLQFSNEHRGNELFKSLFQDNDKEEYLCMLKEYVEENANIFYMVPKEGNIVIFPSKTVHSTKSISENFNDERLAIVGDIVLVLKEEYLSFSHGFITQKFWKKYG